METRADVKYTALLTSALGAVGRLYRPGRYIPIKGLPTPRY
jgi:hypothetical protein